VLCGPSAGSLCWFEQALSAFHGAPRGVRGLGLLPYSNCVHYDAEPARRAEYHRFVGDGMRAGFAAEDGVALHFHATSLARVVSSRREAFAYQVEPDDDGVVETRLEATYLGARGAAPEPPAPDPPAVPPRAAVASPAFAPIAFARNQPVAV
jgi:peptidase E